jgi:uncharacterized membrane protein
VPYRLLGIVGLLLLIPCLSCGYILYFVYKLDKESGHVLLNEHFQKLHSQPKSTLELATVAIAAICMFIYALVGVLQIASSLGYTVKILEKINNSIRHRRRYNQF